MCLTTPHNKIWWLLIMLLGHESEVSQIDARHYGRKRKEINR